MADAPGYVAIAVALITGGTQFFTTRATTAAKAAVEDAKKSIAESAIQAQNDAKDAKAAVEALRTYVRETVGPVLTELQGLRNDVRRSSRSATQSSLPEPEYLRKMLGLDDIERRLGDVDKEQEAARSAELGRQREMGEVMALLRLAVQNLPAGQGARR